MDLNKLIQIVMKDAQKLMEQHIKEQEQRVVVGLIETNRTLIMARTINRLIPPELIEAELQKSLIELNGHYCKEIYNNDKSVDAIHELTGAAKGSAIDVLTIADEMEID